jgi:quinol-cytochrome oxidoreductase complex cytochrome b subunit
MSKNDDYAKQFIELSFQSKGQFDKALLTLSSAAIGVIVSFSKSKNLLWQHQLALWIFLGTIFFTLMGLLALHYMFLEAHSLMEEDDKKEEEKHKRNGRLYESIQTVATFITVVLFFAGMVFTVLGFVNQDSNLLIPYLCHS